MPPTAIFWGARNSIIPVRHGRDTARSAVNVKFMVYDRVGHYPHLDAPDVFARDLAEYLTHPARPPPGSNHAEVWYAPAERIL